MTSRTAMALIALMVLAGLMLAILPAFAQVDQPRIERPRVNTGPTLQVDPQILQRRPNLQVLNQKVQMRAQFDERLHERAAGMRAYSLQRSPVTRETVRLLGADYLMAGQLRSEGNTFEATSDDVVWQPISLDRETGRLTFQFNLAELIDGVPGDLPSDQDAAKVAMEFLQGYNLMPNSEQAVVAHIGRIKSMFDKVMRPAIEAKVVHFARNVDGFRVVGQGSKAVVQIGDGGEVAGGGVQWRALGRSKQLGPEQLRSVEDINGAIVQRLVSEFGGSESIVLERVGLFYHDEGGYMQPVAGFQASIATADTRFSYFGQVPVMQNPPVKIGPEPITKEMREMLQMGSEDMQAPTEGSD
ncbi:MAG: hypothetical protein GF393_05640 [Armatimonadia bacterium]|nr:hypothetical protein [Armatimonadia bacterium]